MSVAPATKFDPEKFADLLTGLDQKAVEEQIGKLSNTRRKAVVKVLASRKPAEAGAGDKDKGKSADDDSEDEDFDWNAFQGQGGAETGLNNKITVIVSETEMDKMWSSVDGNDLGDIDEEALGDFDYQGFDAATILKEIMKHGRSAGLSDKEILKDISTMASIAQKKGSITDKNYPKMKKAGQARYDTLAARYHIVKGSGQGKSPEVITVSRVGPTFPGRIMRMILAKKLSPRSFVGPFKSASMIDIFQTQAFPTAIVSTMEDVAKDYLIGLCIAYSCDQSIGITPKDKKPPTPEEALKSQTNFIHLSYGSKHPTDEMRKDMMKGIDWPLLYDKSNTCASAYKKYQPEFVIPSRTDFLVSVAKF